MYLKDYLKNELMTHFITQISKTLDGEYKDNE